MIPPPYEESPEEKNDVLWQFAEYVREIQDRINHEKNDASWQFAEYLREIQDRIDREKKKPRLSDEFLKKFEDKINWNEIFKYQRFSDEFLKKLEDKFNRNISLIEKTINYNFLYSAFIFWILDLHCSVYFSNIYLLISLQGSLLQTR